MSKDMSVEALDKVGNLLKSMTVETMEATGAVLFAPVKISAAIMKLTAEEAKKKLEKDE